MDAENKNRKEDEGRKVWRVIEGLVTYHKGYIYKYGQWQVRAAK